ETTNRPIARGCKTSMKPPMSPLSYKPPKVITFVATPSIQSLIHTKSCIMPQPIFRRRSSYSQPLEISRMSDKSSYNFFIVSSSIYLFHHLTENKKEPIRMDSYKLVIVQLRTIKVYIILTYYL